MQIKFTALSLFFIIPFLQTSAQDTVKVSTLAGLGNNAEKFYNSGLSKFATKDFNGAITDFNQAITMNAESGVRSWRQQSGIVPHIPPMPDEGVEAGQHPLASLVIEAALGQKTFDGGSSLGPANLQYVVDNRIAPKPQDPYVTNKKE